MEKLKELILNRLVLIELWADTVAIDSEIKLLKESIKLESLEDCFRKLERWDIWEYEYLSAIWFNYMVNITTEDKSKKAVITDILNTKWIEFDVARWDLVFKTKEEAQEYANTFNL